VLLLDALAARGHVRSTDLDSLRISRSTLYRMMREGAIVRVGRGLYTLPGAPWPPEPFADVTRQIPNGRICLLSALQFHRLTTQAPFEVWVAIHPKARRPAVKWPPVRLVRFSGGSLTAGVENHDIDGVSVSVYGPAKTVADCFKYRNKIGLDVALEALRSAWQERRVTIDELWHYARICRVARVMQPYLESVVSLAGSVAESTRRPSAAPAGLSSG
jgi:predicted transcriptional regulator of viral defense system